MELNIQQEELAGAYVKQELTNKVLSDFETELAHNAALQEEVIFQKSILSALKLDRVEQAMHQAKIDNMVDDKKENPQFKVIQNNMQQARISNINRQKRIRRWWMSGLAVAACMLGVVFFGGHLMSGYQLNNEIANWQVKFEDPAALYETVSMNDIATHIQTAEKHYAKGDLKAALAALSVMPEYEMPHYALLAKGKIYAQLENYPKSKQLLLLATESPKTLIRDDAHLALGMIHLRLNNKKEAKKQLMQISTESQKRKAEQVMKKYL